jgi:AcrR family transcriptional regulator
MSDDLSTRNRIVREATRLFASQGVKATTVAQIEEIVGLRAGSGGLHRHFKTKDALVTEVLEAQFRRGQQTRDSGMAMPRPKPEQIRSFLELVGSFTLFEANESREVALIMFKEAVNYPELIRPHQIRNDELAYGGSPDRIRAMFAEHNMEVPEDFDLDAFGYLLVAPLVHYRLYEWLTNEKVRGLTDERVSKMWARIFEPIMRELMDMLPPERSDPGKKS